jgi:hypothetical protein
MALVDAGMPGSERSTMSGTWCTALSRPGPRSSPHTTHARARGLAIDFVVLPGRAQLAEIVTGCGRTAADERGNVATLDDGVAAFNPTERIIEETIIRGRP